MLNIHKVTQGFDIIENFLIIKFLLGETVFETLRLC